MQEQKPARLGFRQTIGRGVAGDQYGGDRFVVFGAQPIDDGEAALAAAKAVVAQDQRRLRRAGGEALDRFVAGAGRDDIVCPIRSGG